MRKMFLKGFQFSLLIALLGILGQLSFSANSQTEFDRITIDAVLSWNTFMGSASIDYGPAVVVDVDGNVYVSGHSNYSWGAPINPHNGGGFDDIFVVKLNSNGILQWSTFIGSTAADYASDIAVDGSGNVYVLGDSYATWGTPVDTYAGNREVFVAKLNSSGELQWNTFLGSSGPDYGYGIAVDDSGNVYTAGSSPATWGTPVNAHAGSGDAFAAKLNSSGTRLWNTFMGSSSIDGKSTIAVDGSGNVYVAGESDATWGTPVNAHAGSGDAFVAKLNSSGELQWNTFLGSINLDECSGIGLDGMGNIYISGNSAESWGMPIDPHSGGTQFDAFAAKLDNSGIRQWNTFMGTAGAADYDTGNAIAVDTDGDVFVVGQSEASWGTPENPHSGDMDAFAVMLDSTGIRQWNTFVGSGAYDVAEDAAVDDNGNAYISGYSTATWGAPVNGYTGSYDAFAVKINYEPEIKVRFGGINFNDGSTRNLGNRTSSFIMGREFTFTIDNLGGGPLNLTGMPMVTLSGPQAAHFYISQQPTSPVAAGGSTTFKLRTVRDSLPGFLPIGWSYPVSITVNIPNDDADENPYNFTINFTLEKDS